MTKPNTTDITVVLDRSGSMVSIAGDMRGGFDSFIRKQREIPGDCRVTLVQFDDKYDTVYTALPVHVVPPLVLEPRGSTALLDAVGRTINATGRRLHQMSEGDRPSQVLFVIITDGEENASHEFLGDKVATMTKHQREQYKWEFIYLGANQDAFAVAQKMGILRNAVTYQHHGDGAQAMFNACSASIGSYRSGGEQLNDNLIGQAVYDAELAKITGSTPPKI